MFIRGFVVAATGLAIGLGVSQASAQQFNEPFSFRVHNNVAAMNMAVILRNVQNGGSSSSPRPGAAGRPQARPSTTSTRAPASAT